MSQIEPRKREILCIAYGNVQGVFYRRFLREKALEFRVTGSTENKPDGTVEIIAQGTEENLKRFLEFVYAGPAEAEVESVNVQWGPVTEPMTDFLIL